MNWSSSTVKRLSLELGGNAPFVVFDDASVDDAVNYAMASKFRNAGQTCVSADRFLVQSGVYEEFVEKFSEMASNLVVGAGMDPQTTMGPLITAEAADRVSEKVQKAIGEGSRCLSGGSKISSLGGHFMEPTILADVDTQSDIWKTETFGPVAAIRSFDTEIEALEIANDCSVGLASYFCTQDLSRAFRFAKQYVISVPVLRYFRCSPFLLHPFRLECGIVGINDGIISSCVAPFGGIKESGLGREGSPAGLAEYLETKYVWINY